MSSAKKFSLSLAITLVTALLSSPSFSQPSQPIVAPVSLDGGPCICNPFNPFLCCLARE
jgi:hypothetical protein